jgi:hypothetical protein
MNKRIYSIVQVEGLPESALGLAAQSAVAKGDAWPE